VNGSALAAKRLNAGLRADETRARRQARRLRDASTPEPFSARRALKRSGVLVPKLGRELAGDAARGAGAIAERQPFNLGAAGGLVIAFAAGLVGLIFLDLLVSDRGSRAVSRLLGGTSRAVDALANPTHPLFVKSAPGDESIAPTAAGRARQASQSPSTSVTAAQAGVVAGPGSSGDRLELFRPTSTEWGGSKSIAGTFARVAINAGGLAVTSTKRDTQHTASGGVSDHWVGSKTAYAYDLSGTVARMDKAAAALMAVLGIPWDGRSAIVQNVTRFGYRLQILYRTHVGGNHFDHIHLGVRKETS
jgi:hypothetical protein